MTIWIITQNILFLRETVLPNHYTLQLTQPADTQHIHITEAIVTNRHIPQQGVLAQIEFDHIITHSITNHEFGCVT